MLRKITNCKSFSEKILWWNSYSVQPPTLLQRELTTDCFWNMYWKLAVLKKIFWGKNLWWARVLIKLQPCSTQFSNLKKSGAHVRPSCRSAKSSNIFTGKPPWLRPFFTESLEFIFAISLKRSLTQSVSYMGFAQQLFLNCQNIFKIIS